MRGKKSTLKPILVFALAAMLMFGAFGCKKSGSSDYTGDLKYATGFSIEYLEGDVNGMKLVTDGGGNQILLLQKDQEAPDEYAELTSIQIPIDDVIYTSTTQVGYLRAFDDDSLFDTIVGVRATADTWNFNAMRSRMESGQIVDVGSNTTMSTSYDYEIIESLQPKLVVTSTGISAEQDELRTYLDQSGIPYIYDASSLESDSRGILEWVKFYAAFYNLEEEADAYYDAALENIDEVIDAVTKIDEEDKVNVGWGIVAMGTIYIQGADSSVAQMIRDSGANYAFDEIGAGQSGMFSVSAEEFYAVMEDVDIFINRGMPKYGPDIVSITSQLPILEDLEAMQEGNVWQITDYYWNSYHNMDGKYLELAEIFYPEMFDKIEVEDFEHFLLMPAVAE